MSFSEESRAIVDTINKYTQAKAQIKWPNDIYIGNKKIGGILIENTLSSNLITGSIIGIGLNINQQEFQRESATSLINEIGTEYELHEILTIILQQFEHYLFRKEDINGLRQLYYKDLLGLHENRQFQNINGDIFEGKIILPLKKYDPNENLLTFSKFSRSKNH